MILSNLKPGQKAIVDRLISSADQQGIVQKLEAMGIVGNRPVQVLGEAENGDILQIRVGSKEIAIRNQEAEMIMIKTDVHNQTNLFEDSEIMSDTNTELNKQVQTASLVSLMAIIIVCISGFYRIMITRNIHQLKEEKIATNIVYDSGSEVTKNEKVEVIDLNKVSTKTIKNVETGNNQSESPEQAAKITNTNTNNHLKATNHSPPANTELTTKKITSPTELAQLKEKLYNTINQTWKNPIDLTSIYLVKVDKNGEIATYEPVNQVAVANLEKTPITSLINSEMMTQTDSLKTDWAEFTLIFYQNGTLEIQSN